MRRAMNRRKFLKTLGAVGAGAVVVAQMEACAQQPTATVAPATVAPTSLPAAGATNTAAAPTTAATAAPAPTSAAATAVSPTEVATSAATTAATAAPTTAAAATPAAGASMVLDAYTFFNPVESAFIEAAVARLIPNDDLGPGAFEAGVAHFIDRQLTGGYGIFDRHFTAGPWIAGTPQQGYQLKLVPRDIYHLGILAANAYANTTFQKTFAELTPEQMDQVLTDMQGGEIEFEGVPAGLFFSTLLSDTKDGFFGDPDYGGNRDKVGWKLVGFPGIAVAYNDWITRYNEPFTGPTRSIAEAEAEGHTS